jgi:pyridoxal 5'-phosphate synthase / NAD(P)H-hydrate epimerase
LLFLNFRYFSFQKRGQKAAQELDEDLMGPLGFSIDQLMELAGLSVASAVATEYSTSSFPRVLILAGPGNNGGDGLVAARHLHHFGYTVSCCYPKRTDKQLYRNLVTQCTSLGIPFLDVEEVLAQPLSLQTDIVLDSLFGFSFKGTPRAPFDGLIKAMAGNINNGGGSVGYCGSGDAGGDNSKTKNEGIDNRKRPVIVAVDIPSGWDVEQGDVAQSGLSPDMLVSLTSPKNCARFFLGAYHYLGGRFVPPQIVEKYSLKLPAYPGVSQCVWIGGK